MSYYEAILHSFTLEDEDYVYVYIVDVFIYDGAQARAPASCVGNTMKSLNIVMAPLVRAAPSLAVSGLSAVVSL